MTLIKHKISKRLAIFTIIASLSLMSSGCATYHVYQIGGEGGRERGNTPGTEWKGKTLNSFAWGLVRQDLPVDNCQMVNGERFNIEEVKVESKAIHTIASIVTLGFWMPLEVSYRCAKPKPITCPLD